MLGQIKVFVILPKCQTETLNLKSCCETLACAVPGLHNTQMCLVKENLKQNVFTSLNHHFITSKQHLK